MYICLFYGSEQTMKIKLLEIFFSSGKNIPLKYFWLSVFFILIACWQLTLLQGSVLFDLLDVVFPFRYYFSLCVQEGYFPHWNPFIQTGVPYYADLQAPTYYPELFLISLFTYYNLYIIQFLLLFYICVSAVGMYKLAYEFTSCHRSSLFASLSYALSGFMIGHGQHLFLLIGAAWLPFVLLHFIRMHTNGERKDVLFTVIYLFLLLTGAYQAVSMVLLYVLLIISAFYILGFIRRKDLQALKNIFLQYLLLSVLLVLLCLPLFTATLEVWPLVSRFEKGVNTAYALSGNNLSTLWSFLYPFSIAGNESFFSADISLRNFYIGILPLVFFIVYLFKPINKVFWCLFIPGLFLFLASFSHSPIRQFMFVYLPFHDLYIHASYLLMFFTLPLSLGSAMGLSAWLKREEHTKKVALVVLSVCLLPVLVFFGYALIHLDAQSLFGHAKSGAGIYAFLKSLSYTQRIFIQGLLLIPLLFFAVYVLKYKKEGVFRFLFLCLLAELFFATQLSIPFTMLDMHHKPSHMQSDLQLYPKGFYIPPDAKVNLNDLENPFYTPFWRNTSIFTRQVSFEAFSSFKLKSLEALQQDDTLRNRVLNNHLGYFSDRVYPLARKSEMLSEQAHKSNLLFVENETYEKLKAYRFPSSDAHTYRLSALTSSYMQFMVHAHDSTLFTVLQTHYPHWRGSLNGEAIPVYRTNHHYMTVLLPKGTHKLQFHFENSRQVYLTMFSTAFFFALLCFSLLYAKQIKASYIFFVSILVFTVFLYLAHFSFHNSSARPATFHSLIASGWEKENQFLPLVSDSVHVRSEQEFIPLARFIQQEYTKSNSVSFRFHATMFPARYQKIYIVFDRKKQDERTEWYGYRINKQMENIGRENQLNVLKNFPEMKPGEEIDVYIWNPERDSIRFNNIQIQYR